MPKKIESEFTALCEKINKLLQESADCVNAANKLAEENDQTLDDLYYEGHIDTYPMKQAVGALGWNSSSLNC